MNQLYRVQEFNWGGLHQNSLEKTIVDNYVKKITDYEALCRCVENELLVSMRGYVVCSWYNHWTSIIIEDIFKDHVNVLPAVGLVKKIDFFVRDVPFDLKVTYLPEGYLSEKRKAAGHRPELTLLKRTARTHGLSISADLADAALLQDLWAKVSDHPSPTCKQLIAELVNLRNALVSEIERSPDDLIRWLYENQGDRRFDASNRCWSTNYGIISILGNSSERSRSWKRRFAVTWTVAATIRGGELSSIGKVNAIRPFQTCWLSGTVRNECLARFVNPSTVRTHGRRVEEARREGRNAALPQSLDPGPDQNGGNDASAQSWTQPGQASHRARKSLNISRRCAQTNNNKSTWKQIRIPLLAALYAISRSKRISTSGSDTRSGSGAGKGAAGTGADPRGIIGSAS